VPRGFVWQRKRGYSFDDMNTGNIMPENKKNPNRVMHAMIAISMVIHAFLCIHIAGIYRSEALTCIELVMRDVSKPERRVIPRPSRRHKAPRVHDVKKMNVSAKSVASITTDMPDYNDGLVENIAVPDAAHIIGSDLDGWGSPGDVGTFTNRRDYFDMVRLKIESRKQYPREAREHQIQGRVKVRFVITTDGQISSLRLAKSSTHNTLDRAALAAVENAMPFPPLPANLFDGEKVTVEITVIFELT